MTTPTRWALLNLIGFLVCGVICIWYYVAYASLCLASLALILKFIFTPLIFLYFDDEVIKTYLNEMLIFLKVLTFSAVVAFSLSWSPRVFKRWEKNVSLQLFPKKNPTPDEIEVEIRSRYRITCFQGNEYRIEFEQKHMEGYGVFASFEEAEEKLEKIIAKSLEDKLRSTPEMWEVVR